RPNQPARSIDSRPLSTQTGPMEQQSNSRVNFSEPVMITALRKDDTLYLARFVDSSGDGVTIKSNADWEVGSLLRLEVGDDVMLAEVCSSEPDEGEYNARLVIL